MARPIFERRRRDVERVNAMSAKDTTASGRVLIMGTGDCQVEVLFPVSFSNRPFFTYGQELDEEEGPRQEVVPGRYPTVDATVIAWQTVRAVEGAFDGYYTGCTLACHVGGGNSEQRLWVDWQFRGVAIRNPISAGQDGLEG